MVVLHFTSLPREQNCFTITSIQMNEVDNKKQGSVKIYDMTMAGEEYLLQISFENNIFIFSDETTYPVYYEPGSPSCTLTN